MVSGGDGSGAAGIRGAGPSHRRWDAEEFERRPHQINRKGPKWCPVPFSTINLNFEGRCLPWPRNQPENPARAKHLLVGQKRPGERPLRRASPRLLSASTLLKPALPSWPASWPSWPARQDLQAFRDQPGPRVRKVSPDSRARPGSRANPDYIDYPVRRVREGNPDPRARLGSRANQARRGLREPKGIGVIRAYRVRLGQRVRREIVAQKDLRESQPLPNGAKAAGASEQRPPHLQPQERYRTPFER